MGSRLCCQLTGRRVQVTVTSRDRVSCVWALGSAWWLGLGASGVLWLAVGCGHARHDHLGGGMGTSGVI